MHGRSTATALVAAAILVSAAACSGAPSAPTWTQAPPATAPSASPAESTTPSPEVLPTAEPTPSPEPTATPEPTADVTPNDSGEPSPTGLTEEEFRTLTGGNATLAPGDPPPAVDRARAEAIVRAAYPGDRPLVAVELVAIGDAPRLGWLVVLGTATGQSCALHPGLLERALEGAIVDAGTGDIFWTMTCG